MRTPRRRRRMPALLTAAVIGAVAITATPTAGFAASGPDRTAPTAPSNVRVVAVGETSVSLTWTASTDNSGPIRYVIDLVDRPFSFGPFTATSGTVNDSTLLPPDTTHRMRVRAYDGAFNYSAPSNTVTVTTLPDLTPPTAPSVLRLVGATPHTVKLEWNPGTDNVGWPHELSYRVSLGSTVIGSSRSLNGQPVRFERRYLPVGAELTFTVHTVDRVGNLSTPTRLTVDLPDSTDVVAPNPPVLTTAVDDGYGHAKLTWQPATDDSTAQADLEYEFLVNGVRVLFNGGETVYPVVRGGTTGWVPVLAAPGSFSFTVVAVDRAGNVSAPSNAITANVTTDGY
nr:hypothetical protein [Micromonospora sp. DSM 115978]